MADAALDLVFQAAARGALPTPRPPLTPRARMARKQDRTFLDVCNVYGIRLAADSTCYGWFDGVAFAQRAQIRLLRARLFWRAGGRKRIEENKYEKSVDNRSAALVSRIPGVRNERLETRKTHCLRRMSPLRQDLDP